MQLEAQPEGGFLVLFPDVPEAVTQGEDREDALERAVPALETALSFYMRARQPLPKPSPAKGRPTVRPAALECAKLGLYEELLRRGVRKAELARRLGWRAPQVDRLLNLRHASRMDQIEAAARALGCRVDLRIANAPMTVEQPTGAKR